MTTTIQHQVQEMDNLGCWHVVDNTPTSKEEAEKIATEWKELHHVVRVISSKNPSQYIPDDVAANF
jgi:hypothetical protein